MIKQRTPADASRPWEHHEIIVDGMHYGIAAQYSVVNPAHSGQEADMQQWFGTVPGYSATYPVIEMDFTSIQTTNLYNTYVETGTFVIQKRDDGTNYAEMPNVPVHIRHSAGVRTPVRQAFVYRKE